VESRYLVTGAEGCIGSWTLKNLVQAGKPVVGFDMDTRHRRPRQLLTADELAQVVFVQGDLRDTEQVLRVVADHRITHIIHLGALQVPFCRADPVLGAQVNVVGTVNIFEAARRCAGQVQGLSYASSAAVIGPEEAYELGRPIPDNAPLMPRTLYGVYKQANEGTAQVYWLENGVRSVGLRPWTVYGVGRDQGMTSDPTRAIKAAVLGRPYRMTLGGVMDMQYADDVARAFIASAEATADGAPVFNLRGVAVGMDEVVAEIERQLPEARGLIQPGTSVVPIAPYMDDSGLRALLGELPRTDLATGIAETVRLFQALLSRGELDTSDLPPSEA